MDESSRERQKPQQREEDGKAGDDLGVDETLLLALTHSVTALVEVLASDACDNCCEGQLKLRLVNAVVQQMMSGCDAYGGEVGKLERTWPTRRAMPMMRSIAILMVLDYFSVLFCFISLDLLTQSLIWRSKNNGCRSSEFKVVREVVGSAARFVRLQCWHVSCSLRLARIRRYGNVMRRINLGVRQQCVLYIRMGRAESRRRHSAFPWQLRMDPRLVSCHVNSNRAIKHFFAWRSMELAAGLCAATSTSCHLVTDHKRGSGRSEQASSTFARPELWLAFVIGQ